MRNLVPRLLLHLEKLYNRYTSFPRGRFAFTRLIKWGQQHLGFKAPLLCLESGIVLEYSSGFRTDLLLRDLLITGSFEPSHTEIIKGLLPVGGVFIDVGANIGYFSIIGARSVGPTGRVYAFEPMDETYRLLRKNLSLNKLTNVEAVNLACFSSSGRVAMERTCDSGTSHLSFIESENSKTVCVTTLDEFVAQSGIKRIDVIKIDTEGCDLEVLKGARQTIAAFRPAILIELNHLSRFGGSISEVSVFFARCLYEISEIKGKYSVDLLCKPTKSQ